MAEIRYKGQIYSGAAAFGSADDVSYDNTQSGLTATDVQGAVDELNSKIPVDFETGILLTRSAPSTVLPLNAKMAIVCVYIESLYYKTVNITIPLKMLTANQKTFNSGFYFTSGNCAAVSINATKTSNGYSISFDTAYVNGSAVDLPTKAIVFYL